MAMASEPQRGLQVPDHFTFSEQQDGVLITYRWFNWRAPIFLMAGMFVMGAAIMMVNVLGGVSGQVNPALLLVFGFMFCYGLWLTYYSLAIFLNSTQIAISSSFVMLNRGPVPGFGRKRIALSDITRAQLNEKTYGNQYETSTVYDVMLTLESGDDVCLVKALHSEEQAAFLTQQLRSWIVISSQQVPQVTAEEASA